MRTAIVLALALGSAQVVRAAEDAPKEAAESVVDLTDVQQAKALCLATRPAERVFFEGDAVAKASAREKYTTERSSAVERLYRLRLPHDGFKLGAYDAKDQSLDLDLSYAPRALQGALTLTLPNDAPMAFEITPQQAKDIAAAMKAGTATLTAYFQLNEDQGAVCSGSVAAGVFNIAALPVSFELQDQSGHALGRADSPRAERYRAVIGGYSGTPTAVLGTVEGDGVDVIPIARKLASTIEPLKKCYSDRLRERSDAGGSAVIGVEVKASGQVDTVTFIADALGDDTLRKCVEATFKGSSFAGVPGLPTLFRVPVEMKLTPNK